MTGRKGLVLDANILLRAVFGQRENKEYIERKNRDTGGVRQPPYGK